LIRRKPRILVNFALSLALMLAQAGALLHFLGHDESSQPGSAHPAQLCGQCLLFSTVMSAAGGGQALLVTFDAGGPTPPTVIQHMPGGDAAHRYFWSRGPPIPC
jgi:hypothetical protein